MPWPCCSRCPDLHKTGGAHSRITTRRPPPDLFFLETGKASSPGHSFSPDQKKTGGYITRSDALTLATGIVSLAIIEGGGNNRLRVVISSFQKIDGSNMRCAADLLDSGSTRNS